MEGRTEPKLRIDEGLRRTWGQMFLYTFATRIAVSLLVLPLLAILLRLFLSIRGRNVLSDTEIVSFVLSPVGVITLLILGGFWIGVAFIEQAGLMSIGYAAINERRFHWFAAMKFVAVRLRRILPLGSHLLARSLVVVIPFLIPAGVICWFFLRHHDINYYLSNRPPEFYQAGIPVGIILAVMVAVLALKVAGWLLALPILLFEDRAPSVAIRESVLATKGHKLELAGWLAAWLVSTSLVSVAATWLVGFAGRLIIPDPIESAALVSLLIGSVGAITILLNTVVTILAAAFFGMIVVRFYRKYGARGSLPGPLASSDLMSEPRKQRIPEKRFFWGSVGLAAFAAAATWWMLSQVRMDDDVLIIAHRGSAATAPENTMAAVRDAIEAGADFVEIDVQESAEGEIIVFHDSDFMKTGGDPLKIWDATREDLDRLDIGSWFDSNFASERVPTLEEVLSACKGRAKVNIELKYYGHDENLEQKVIDAVEKHGMKDEVVIMSLKPDKVAKIKAMRPDWTYGLLSSVQLGDISQFDVSFLAVNAKGAPRHFINHAQNIGFHLYVWTVNDPFEMMSMMSRGVNGIITDKPELARRVLEIRKELNPVERLLIGVGSEVGVIDLRDRFGKDEDA